jgi:hypothetical protein
VPSTPSSRPPTKMAKSVPWALHHTNQQVG